VQTNPCSAVQICSSRLETAAAAIFGPEGTLLVYILHVQDSGSDTCGLIKHTLKVATTSGRMAMSSD